jgi:class 3 adenylate cyclase
LFVRELPSGTVTFLFTDIEGSTRLLHELGDAYADALAEHRRVLRDAFARHSGVEVDTQGTRSSWRSLVRRMRLRRQVTRRS